MAKKTIEDVNVTGKRVLVRVDFNVLGDVYKRQDRGRPRGGR